MPVFNITLIQTTLVGGEGEDGAINSSFHGWSKITQCLKNSQPFLAAIVAIHVKMILQHSQQ